MNAFAFVKFIELDLGHQSSVVSCQVLLPSPWSSPSLWESRYPILFSTSYCLVIMCVWKCETPHHFNGHITYNIFIYCFSLCPAVFKILFLVMCRCLYSPIHETACRGLKVSRFPVSRVACGGKQFHIRSGNQISRDCKRAVSVSNTWALSITPYTVYF